MILCLGVLAVPALAHAQVVSDGAYITLGVTLARYLNLNVEYDVVRRRAGSRVWMGAGNPSKGDFLSSDAPTGIALTVDGSLRRQYSLAL